MNSSPGCSGSQSKNHVGWQAPNICLICRIEGMNTPSLHNVYLTDVGDTKLYHKINLLYGVELRQGNGWPSYVCSVCYANVVQACQTKEQLNESVKLYNGYPQGELMMCNENDESRNDISEFRNDNNESPYDNNEIFNDNNDYPNVNNKVQNVTSVIPNVNESNTVLDIIDIDVDRNLNSNDDHDDANDDYDVEVNDYDDDNSNGNNDNDNGDNDNVNGNNDNVNGDVEMDNDNNDDNNVEDDDDDCQIIPPPPNPIINLIDSDEEDNPNEIVNQNLNVDKLLLCPACKKMKNKHKCFPNNNELSTCLIPGCVALFQSFNDFKHHYLRHNSMSLSDNLCDVCYCKIGESPHTHIHADTSKLFKCYTCPEECTSMEDLAYHKLQLHSGLLINTNGLYLCFHCNFMSIDRLKVIGHLKTCNEQRVIEAGNQNQPPVPNPNKILTSKLKLFTCLFCNVIFRTFFAFKTHYSEHFDVSKQAMCWQCFKPQSSLKALRAHQRKNQCTYPEPMDCDQCSLRFFNIQDLSLHKYLKHDAKLIYKLNSIKCIFCKMVYFAWKFREHLINCPMNREKPSVTASKDIRKCIVCNKIFMSQNGYAAHMASHRVNIIE